MDKKIRLRGPNFTVTDNLLLVEIVDKYKHVIENKKTDGVTLHQKQQAWLNVVKEFNSITSGHNRTLESLQQNYKNLKKKVKKRESDAKMAIPVDRNILVSTVEEHGTTTEGWEQVAQTMGVSQEICIEAFNGIAKEVEIKEIKFKKEAKRTGGGPPPVDENADPVLSKMKALVGPGIDGLYSIYDGDSSLMEILNKTPLEINNISETELEITPNNSTLPNPSCKKNLGPLLADVEPTTPTPTPTSTQYFDNNRANLKRAPHHSLSKKQNINKSKEKITVAENFQELAKNKMELVNMQKEIFSQQLIDLKETLENNRQLRAMDVMKKKNEQVDMEETLEHNRQLRAIELHNMKKKFERYEMLQNLESNNK